MILVDTSVWIRILANREPYGSLAADLLPKRDFLAHELVYGELLMGDRGERRTFFSMYNAFPWAATAEHGEVDALVRERRLTGSGIGWIDAHLLASVLIGRHQLWTADQRLAEVADDLHVGWRAR